MTAVRPGTLLLTPPTGERADDVLCVVDSDTAEPGAAFALLLNRPTEAPAQPLAFGLFDCEDGVAWWAGPTDEVFALVELGEIGGADDRFLPTGGPRRFITERTALFLPGRDHPPESPPRRVRIFSGSVWLGSDHVGAFLERGLVLPASDDLLFDPDPQALAARLRTCGQP